MNEAARVTDLQQCPMCDGTKPHEGGANVDGAATVRIGGLPAAVVGSMCRCLSPKTASIVTGSATVRICGRPAARRGDSTDHGGTIRSGCPIVRLG